MRAVSIFVIIGIMVFVGSCALIPGTKNKVDFKPGSIEQQLNNMTKQMIRSLSQVEKSKIAIMEFADLNGDVSEFGRFIPEELTSRFFISRKFEVIERQLLNKVMQEHNLGLSGLVDSSSAAQLGKLLGVEAIVAGTIADMGNTVRINARLIATETGSVFAVSSVSINKDESILAMMGRASGTAGSSSGSNKKQTQKAISETVVDNIEFKVLSANLANDKSLSIQITVTNHNNQDKEISFSESTTVYDNFGQEYSDAIRVTGSKRAGAYVYLKHLFITGVPTNLELIFKDFDSRAENIALLKIVNRGLSSDVSFRNIPITKQ